MQEYGFYACRAVEDKTIPERESSTMASAHSELVLSGSSASYSCPVNSIRFSVYLQFDCFSEL